MELKTQWVFNHSLVASRQSADSTFCHICFPHNSCLFCVILSAEPRILWAWVLSLVPFNASPSGLAIVPMGCACPWAHWVFLSGRVEHTHTSCMPICAPPGESPRRGGAQKQCSVWLLVIALACWAMQHAGTQKACEPHEGILSALYLWPYQWLVWTSEERHLKFHSTTNLKEGSGDWVKGIEVPGNKDGYFQLVTNMCLVEISFSFFFFLFSLSSRLSSKCPDEMNWPCDDNEKCCRLIFCLWWVQLFLMWLGFAWPRVMKSN